MTTWRSFPAVGDELRHAGIDLPPFGHVARPAEQPIERLQLFEETVERERRRIDLHRARLEPQHRERVLDEVTQVEPAGQHALADLAPLGARHDVTVVDRLEQHARIAEQDVQRRAELVRHHAEELGLQPIALDEPLGERVALGRQPLALQRLSDATGEARDELHVLVAERARLRVRHADDADHRAAGVENRARRSRRGCRPRPADGRPESAPPRR
jgi:hypothetical protein